MAAFGIGRQALSSPTPMKRLCLFAFLPLALFAQDQLSTTDTAALKAELDNLKAQYDVLKAKNDLATLQLNASPADAKAKAEKDARDKVTVDTINAISGLAGKLPAGSYTTTADGVATPKGMELAFANLSAAAKGFWAVKAHKDIAAHTLVFVDAIPSAPRASLEKKLYDKLLADVERDGNAILKPGASAEIAPIVPVLITALPGILNAVGGFFRVDYSEKTFDAKLGAATAISSAIGQLGDQRLPAIYLSLESFAFADGVDFAQSPLVQAIERVKTIDQQLEAKAKAVNTQAQEKAVALAAADLDETKAKLAELGSRRDLLGELAKISPKDAQPYLDKVEQLGIEIAKLERTKTEQSQALDAAKTALANASAPRTRISGVRDRIAKLFAALTSTDGTPPLFVRLMRDEALAEGAAKDVRLIALSVASSIQGTVTKKRFWGQTTYGSSLVALEYRVADGTGKLLSAGVLPYFDLQKLNQ